ncbi:MAG: DUF3078 domain-containing protein [Gemmatimonadetes bacterium]|nr:DUF3078 domain-containing protein [Gemmatimonadota bacterium]
MNKRTMLGAVALAALVALPGQAFSEDEKKDKKRVLELGKYYPSLESGVNLSQSAYSDNWAGGDKGSIVWTWLLNGTLENQLNKGLNWNNNLKLAFGQTHQQDAARNWGKPDKSTDLIDYETIFRFTRGWLVDPFVSGRFESQFIDDSDALGRSLNFNPLKFKETGGVARQFIDEEDRSLLSRLGFTFRQSVRDQFSDSVDTTNTATFSQSTNDGGIEWITDYKTKILEDRVTWTSKLSLYQPIFYSDKDNLEMISAADLTAAGLASDIADYSTTMDIDFENIFSAQITKIIAVNLYTRWVYDKFDNTVGTSFDEDGMLLNGTDLNRAIRKAGQFKQTLAIGVTYRFL